MRDASGNFNKDEKTEISELISYFSENIQRHKHYSPVTVTKEMLFNMFVRHLSGYLLMLAGLLTLATLAQFATSGHFVLTV